MSIKRSVLDRTELYFPAPILSGQASYGGLPKEVYFLTACAFVGVLGITMIAMMLIVAFTGSYGKWMWVIPIVVPACYALCLTGATKKRRDAIVIFRESRRLEKKERRA